MKLVKNGKDILASVENITPFGVWLFVNGREYFLNYHDYPYFKDKTIKAIQNMRFTHGFHLYWPDLDIDLDLDSLEYPEKYPLRSRSN